MTWVTFEIWREDFQFGMGVVKKEEHLYHNLLALSQDECECRPTVTQMQTKARDGVMVAHKIVYDPCP